MPPQTLQRWQTRELSKVLRNSEGGSAEPHRGRRAEKNAKQERSPTLNENANVQTTGGEDGAMAFVTGALLSAKGKLVADSICTPASLHLRQGCPVLRPSSSARTVVKMAAAAAAGGGGGNKPPPLESLVLMDYIDAEGVIPYDTEAGKVGVYAIFDQDKKAVYLGKSRDVQNSLRMHLTRVTEKCYFFKVFNVPRPSRTAFDEMIKCWTEELGGLPEGNASDELRSQWENAIDARTVEHTAEEKEALADMSPTTELKILKNIARRVQKEIEQKLRDRNVKEKMRFNPKLKMKGLLDIESSKIEVPAEI